VSLGTAAARAEAALAFPGVQSVQGQEVVSPQALGRWYTGGRCKWRKEDQQLADNSAWRDETRRERGVQGAAFGAGVSTFTWFSANASS